MDLSQKAIKLIKDVDKLVETVKKGAIQIAVDAKALKDSFGKSEGEQEK